MPGLQQHDLEPGLHQAGMEPLRERASLQTDAGERQTQLGQKGGQRLGFAGDFRLPDDLF